MVLEISSALVARLLAEAAASPYAEVCGLLFGTDMRIEAVETCRNVAEDSTRQFELDPAVVFAAIRAERGGGPRLIGYWHSHLNGAVEPSACDLEAAEDDGKIWVIVAGGDIAAWRVKVSEVFAPRPDAAPERNEDGVLIARAYPTGKFSKEFRHVPLDTGEIRHLVPRAKGDVELVPLIARAGYPAIAPILDALLPWVADPNWPVAPPLLDYLITLGPIMVGPIRRLLRDPDSDAKDGCLLYLVANLELAEQRTLIEDIRAIACSPSERDRYYEADGTARQILDHLNSSGF